MMTKKRYSYTPEFNFRIALEALQSTKTIAPITQETRCIPIRCEPGRSSYKRAASRGFHKE